MSGLLDLIASPWALPGDRLRDMAMSGLDFVKAGARVDRLPAPVAAPEPFVDEESGVAVVQMTGVMIHRCDPILSALFGAVDPITIAGQIDQLAADPEIKGIAIDVDSPGGTVAGTATLRRSIGRANSIKPVVSIIEGACLSAALWAVSGSRAVFASEASAPVGSIGVVATHVDRSGALEQRGLVVSEVTAGRWKAATTPNKPLSEDGRATLQELCDALYAHFLGAVADGRATTRADAHARWGDGRTFLASEAHRLGLIDGIVAREEVLATMAAELAT